MFFLTLSILAQVRQVSPSVKACYYEEFLYKGRPGSSYSGESNSGMEVSYASKSKKYGIEFQVGYRKMSISCSYDRQTSNGSFMYSGVEINTFKEAVIVSKSKLSLFLENHGQDQKDYYDETKSIQVCIDGLPDLYIYPINTISNSHSSMNNEKRIEKEFTSPKPSSSYTYQGYYFNFTTEMEIQNQRASHRAPLIISYDDNKDIYTMQFEYEPNKLDYTDEFGNNHYKGEVIRSTFSLKYIGREKVDGEIVYKYEEPDNGNNQVTSYIESYNKPLYEFTTGKGVKDPNESTIYYFRWTEGDLGVYVFPSLTSIPENYKMYGSEEDEEF